MCEREREIENQRLSTIGNTLLRKPNECAELVLSLICNKFLSNRFSSSISVTSFYPTDNPLQTHTQTHRVHININLSQELLCSSNRMLSEKDFFVVQNCS